MATPMLATTGAARTREGRSITFWATGPHDGFPVVYCHGAIGSPRWRTPQLDELIHRSRIRYLVVNRPVALIRARAERSPTSRAMSST